MKLCRDVTNIYGDQGLNADGRMPNKNIVPNINRKQGLSADGRMPNKNYAQY